MIGALARQTAFTLLIVHVTACGVTHAQGVGVLGVRAERAPWENPHAHAACESGTLLVSSTNGVFASTDGLRWDRDALDDDVQILGTSCVDGVTWGVGRPGIIARRDAGGRWTVEHRVADREEWNRRAELFSVQREPGSQRLHASGLDGSGQPFELARTDAGVWTAVRAPVGRTLEPRSALAAAECRVAPLRSRPPSGAVFTRATMCRGGHIVAWTNASGSRPDSIVRLPPRMRRQPWNVLGASDDSIFLVRAIRGDEIADEVTHHAFARFRGGRWEVATVEAPVVWPSLLRIAGARFSIGTGHIYRFEEPP